MRKSIDAQLSIFIVKETFGKALADVYDFLLQNTKSPLRSIRSRVDLSISQIKLCLAIGIQHNFILVSHHKRGFTEYSVDVLAVLHRLRYPSYVYCVKVLYGNVAEVLIEEILHHGQITRQSLISKTITKVEHNIKEKATEKSISEKLELLMQTRFVEVCLDEQTETSSADEPPPSKRLKRDGDCAKDKVCYKVCVSRFNYYHRDLQIVDAVTRRLSPKHGEIMSTMLRLAEVKNSPSALQSSLISSNEIFNALPKELGITSRTLLDVYLMTLADDEMGIIMKAGDSGGGSYIINYREAVSSLCKASMEAVVLEKFGARSRRLFRLLLLTQHLEQQKLEEKAMMSSKVVNELLYEMFTEQYITATEIAKTTDHVPSKTFYCFTVAVEQLARRLLQNNYQSILNLSTKRVQILADNKRLLEKKQKVDAILATLGEVEAEQRQEVEEIITPSESQQLHTVKLQTDRLENGELQLTASTLIWEIHLEYCTAKRIAENPKPKGAPKT